MPDVALLTWLTAAGRRPNMLVECRPQAIGPVTGYLRESCEGPLRACTLPGVLDLPSNRRGTLLVENVAALTLLQQRQFFEWMSAGCDDVQVVSVTSEPLAQLVEQGDFMESLFYRLNIVRVAIAPVGTLGQDSLSIPISFSPSPASVSTSVSTSTATQLAKPRGHLYIVPSEARAV